MGTSKGYIAPTTIQWSQSKRAVTAFVNNRDSESRIKAASKYATAMKADIASSGNFSIAAGKIASFAIHVHHGGLDSALQIFGREDLIGKSAEEVFDALLSDFTNAGATKEDYLAAQAIGEALDILGIEDLAELGSIATEDLMIEMLSEYLKYSFSFRYSEKIMTGRSPAEAELIRKDMEGYISNTIHSNFDRNRIRSVDFTNLNSSAIVNELLVDALSMFEDFYEE